MAEEMDELLTVDACISASVSKLIFASAGNSLYGRVDADTLPLKEDATLCPRCPSDISKVAGEWYVRYFTRQYGLTHTILRYADVYGDIESERVQHPVSYFVKMLLEQQRSVIRGTGRDGRDSLFIDDVVRANLRALERGKNLTLHISSGLAYNLNQFYYASARLLDSEQKPVYVSGSLAEPTTIALDNTLAQEVLGWRPEITFSEGIRRVVESAQRRAARGSVSQSSLTYKDAKELLDASLRPSKEAVYALSAVKETEYRTLATALA